MALLEVLGLTRRYGETTVLDGLDLDLEPGRLLALVGRNGSGKSTALRCIVGTDQRTGGEVTLEIGSLYRLLARLVTEGLIDDIESADERRRYYRITAAGRRALKSEAARLANVVTLVRARKLLPETDV